MRYVSRSNNYELNENHLYYIIDDIDEETVEFTSISKKG